MIGTRASFYVTGGTLRSDAPSYVERQADRDLHSREHDDGRAARAAPGGGSWPCRHRRRPLDH
jgi:hypothetical protein